MLVLLCGPAEGNFIRDDRLSVSYTSVFHHSVLLCIWCLCSNECFLNKCWKNLLFMCLFFVFVCLIASMWAAYLSVFLVYIKCPLLIYYVKQLGEKRLLKHFFKCSVTIRLQKCLPRQCCSSFTAWWHISDVSPHIFALFHKGKKKKQQKKTGVGSEDVLYWICRFAVIGSDSDALIFNVKASDLCLHSVCELRTSITKSAWLIQVESRDSRCVLDIFLSIWHSLGTPRLPLRGHSTCFFFIYI